MGCSNLLGNVCHWEERCKEENKKLKDAGELQTWCAYVFG